MEFADNTYTLFIFTRCLSFSIKSKITILTVFTWACRIYAEFKNQFILSSKLRLDMIATEKNYQMAVDILSMKLHRIHIITHTVLEGCLGLNF